MKTEIKLPELGAGDSTIRVSGWLVDIGERVAAGDRILEVFVHGMTFDVEAPVDGMLAGIDSPSQSVVSPGDTVGWIE